MYQETTATRKVAALRKRIRAVQGGTSASKTISILIYLIARAQSDKTPTLTSVVAESFPHLRRGAMRDFLLILETQGYFRAQRWSETNHTYTFETGSQIEFFSVDQPEKVRGARRDRLFMNECNNIGFEAFEELEVRTKGFIFLDWNPTNEFWYYTELDGKRDDLDHIILTYRDNEALDANIRASIESRRNRKGWWKVYGEGQLGEVEGRIYTGWQTVDAIPHEARLERYGLDFGYTNDPTAIVGVYRYNGGFILDEITFLKGLQNNQIADILLNEQRALVVADSAEPKSIDELKAHDLAVVPSRKGKDSVRHGINVVQQQRISVTRRSANILREYRNYLWMTDKDGKLVSPNEPEAGFDHSMDATRYALTSMLDFMDDRTAAQQERHMDTVINRRSLQSSK
jgi:phage terminase large subunit